MTMFGCAMRFASSKMGNTAASQMLIFLVFPAVQFLGYLINSLVTEEIGFFNLRT